MTLVEIDRFLQDHLRSSSLTIGKDQLRQAIIALGLAPAAP